MNKNKFFNSGLLPEEPIKPIEAEETGGVISERQKEIDAEINKGAELQSLVSEGESKVQYHYQIGGLQAFVDLNAQTIAKPDAAPNVQKRELRVGFLLDFATCQNCLFRLNRHRKPQTAKVYELKEDIVAAVIQVHDDPSPHLECSERKLIIAFVHCLYEK